ncbi:superoxide dismutase family protein [Halomonas sp. TRM85114]|uniref:superoxide dismutase family protein n=1 Tax=Halomonas jincaotanensis TaxID=2810616 RepID=UPI001BD6D9A7|nr:superoxide dismutase family protein [Halomonas jincaotanensis]MBS9405063.1 superoxide dismutase family protein [Halomonas jincaotanensis]
MRLDALTRVATASLLLVAVSSHANESRDVEMHSVSAEGVGESIGTITLEDTDHGLLLTPDLSGIAPGVHGFHVHQEASCEPGENDSGDMAAALQAGGHYDPEDTGRHEGPYSEGHLGDLPVLIVDDDETATLPVLAPRLSLDDMNGRSLMIHAGGDNYSDDPEPLGGGGGRMACGVVES